MDLCICMYKCKSMGHIKQFTGISFMMCWSQRLNLLSLPLAASTFISDEPSYQLSVFHLLIVFSYTKVNITSTIVEGYENYPNLTNTQRLLKRRVLYKHGIWNNLSVHSEQVILSLVNKQLTGQCQAGREVRQYFQTKRVQGRRRAESQRMRREAR